MNKYEKAKAYIQKIKDEIEFSNSKQNESNDQIKDNEVDSKLQRENEILKHELEITNLKMGMIADEKKIQSDLRSKNANLRSKIAKMTSKIESSKLQYAKFEYNTMLKES